MAEMLQNETLVLALLTVAGAVWAYFKKRNEDRIAKSERLAACIRFIEAGVQFAYEKYVREAKVKNVDGKLHNGQRIEAREKAVAKASELARVRGINLAQELGGSTLLHCALEQAVKRAKRKEA